MNVRGGHSHCLGEVSCSSPFLYLFKLSVFILQSQVAQFVVNICLQTAVPILCGYELLNRSLTIRILLISEFIIVNKYLRFEIILYEYLSVYFFRFAIFIRFKASCSSKRRVRKMAASDERKPRYWLDAPTAIETDSVRVHILQHSRHFWWSRRS